ncbi:MAG: thrombospondin type 3 repeat-containing protein [Kiritimatiellae bacterium]|nr:thrombospondin type 3 repeat-containing protein [Kiritimatiellia bacterium]
MKKDEIINLIRAGYDKIILIVVLAVILASLLTLIVSIGREKKALAENQWEPPLVRSSRQDGQSSTEICDAIEAVNAPFQLEGIARLMVAELRVNCVKCGRPVPINAEICPFRDCRSPQPKIISQAARDSDFDGLPDEWEIRHNFNPNLDDAHQDADGDGFANKEEFQAGTNPRDPASAPPPVLKLRVVKAGRIPLSLSFGGAQRSQEGTIFLVKNKRTRRDYYVRLGDTVDGYKITGYEPKTRKVNKGTFEIEEDVSILKASKDGRAFALIVGDKGGPQGEQAASLIYLIDNVKMLVKKDDIISLKNNKYKVVDIDGQNVTVSDMQSGEEWPLETFESGSNQ